MTITYTKELINLYTHCAVITKSLPIVGLSDNADLFSLLCHKSVHVACYRFYSDQKRKVYVTPTSYLELIKAFQNLYAMKIDQITRARIR